MLIEDCKQHFLSTILGHTLNISFLRKLTASKTIPPALLFLGPAGVGKKSLAYAFAKYALSNGAEDSPEHSSTTGRKIERGIHPDFIELSLAGSLKIVPIDAVRGMQDRVSIAPNESPFRMVLIPQAEGLHPASANALLKTLEEPPAHVLFILVCQNPQELLPTILSRCMRLHFYPLTWEDIENWVKRERTLEATQLHLITSLSQGRPGEVIALLNGDIFKLRETICNCLDLILQYREKALFKSSYILDSSGFSIQSIISILISWFRDLLIIKSTKSDEIRKDIIVNFDLIPILQRQGTAFGESDLMQILNLLISIQCDLYRVLYKTIVWEHIFLFILRTLDKNSLSLRV